MARLCLNMIVKNEAAIIERCLAATAPHVDCYAILDTGSSDDTVARIRAHFDRLGIRGVVGEGTFRHFEQARNDALDLALQSGLDFDYLLLCDADMELQVARRDFRDHLDGAVHSIIQRSADGFEYPNVRLLRRDVPARYRGVTHEYLDVGDRPRPLLDGIAFLDHASGANRAGKYERDIALLSEALRGEPGNARHVFYLANSYYDLGDFTNAITWYARREAMGGWAEEVFYSSYRTGLCLQRLGRDDEAAARLLDTWQRFPERAEPLHALALQYQRTGQHRLVHLVAEAGRAIAVPREALFVETDVYTWRLKDLDAVALYWLGRRSAAAALNHELLQLVPAGERARIAQNLAWCEGRIATAGAPAMSMAGGAATRPWDKYDGIKQWGWYVDQFDAWREHLATDAPVRVLEIGAFDGVSANMMLDAIFTHPQSQVVAIDPYLPDPTTPEVDASTRDTFLRNARIGGHENRIKLLLGESFDLLPQMPRASFDVVYVDGSHFARHVLEDAVLALRLLKPGGIIGFDDYLWTSPTDPGEPGASPKAAIDAFERVHADRIELVFGTRQRFYRLKPDASPA